MYNYSFIIPHKNTPELLQRCLDSIPEREDIQIIVVDDNSDDGKNPTIDRKDVELILLDSEHAKGAGRARNVGIQHAKGKWFLFPDADDYYAEDFIKILDTYIDKDFDILYFCYCFMDGKTGKELPVQNRQEAVWRYDGAKDSRDLLKYRNNVPWSKMVLREYVMNHGFYFEEVPNGNDIFFSLCIGYHTNRIIVDKHPIYVHLRNENSISTSKDSASLATCRLGHVIKRNYFLKHVGHKEWGTSVIKKICLKTTSLGIPFLTVLIKQSIRLYMMRKDWWKIIPALTIDPKRENLNISNNR